MSEDFLKILTDDTDKQINDSRNFFINIITKNSVGPMNLLDTYSDY